MNGPHVKVQVDALTRHNSAEMDNLQRRPFPFEITLKKKAKGLFFLRNDRII